MADPQIQALLTGMQQGNNPQVQQNLTGGMPSSSQPTGSPPPQDATEPMFKDIFRLLNGLVNFLSSQGDTATLEQAGSALKILAGAQVKRKEKLMAMQQPQQMGVS